MQTKNLTALLIAVALIVAVIIYLDNSKASPVASAPVEELVLPQVEPALSTDSEVSGAPSPVERSLKAMRFERAKEITTPDGFLNSLNPRGSAEPMTLGELVGKKVVLLDIWTYSCINCQRTLPYLKAWHGKYKDKGLVIIGLHTPEFEFEKIYDNVRAAVQKFGITYPVVLDNDYSTWRAYRNQYWPRKYLIDIDGYIAYDHIGEGGYEETERQIQKALEERMTRLGEKGSVDIALTKEQALIRPGSPEIYFGASRNENFGNGTRGAAGTEMFSVPEDRKLNTLYLGGTWNIQAEYAENVGAPAVIEFRYKAKEVYFVASSESGVEATIYNDGVLVKGKGALDCSESGFCGGDDVTPAGTVYIKEDRLYKLIQNESIEEHVLKIEIKQPGLKAFTFTFG